MTTATSTLRSAKAESVSHDHVGGGGEDAHGGAVPLRGAVVVREDVAAPRRMASTTLATTAASASPTGFMAVLIMPGMTALTPTGAPERCEFGAQARRRAPSTPCLATV